MVWQIIMVLANVTTCILYPAHTILSYNKTHDNYIEPQYVIDSRAMVNPYDVEDEPVFYRLYALSIFMTTLSEMEYTLLGCECIFLIHICINFSLQANDDAGTPLREGLLDVAYKYCCGRFFLDVIVLLPIGYVLAAYVDKTYL